MIKRFKKLIYINLGKIIDCMIIILGVYAMYNGIIRYDFIFRSCIILGLILIYWNILKQFEFLYGQSLSESMKELTALIKPVSDEDKKIKEEYNKRNEKEEYYREWNLKFFENLLSYKIFEKDWAKDLVYFSWYLLPWMWVYIIIRYFLLVSIYVRVWINGNKDIFFKKVGIDSTEWITEIHKTKIYFWWKHVVIYPILRMLKYLDYIRSKIWTKQWYAIVRIRFIGYFYITFLIYNGYVEVIKYIYENKIILLVIIYIYFAIIYPYILKNFIHGSVSFLYPKYGYWAYSGKTFSLTLNLYSSLVFSKCSDYYIKKYGLCSTQKESINILFGLGNEKYYYIGKHKLGDKEGTYIEKKYNNMVIYKGLWLFEKNYGFSSLAFHKIVFHWNDWKMIIQDQIWEEGILRYGKEYMEKEYGKYYLEILEFHRCYLYVVFEYERLGITEKGWTKEQIPNKFQGIKMYKDSINMINFFYGITSIYGYGIWVREFSYSSAIVEYMDFCSVEKQEEYKKNLLTYKKGMEGKFLNLVEKIELDTPLFYSYGFDNDTICNNMEDPNREGYVYLKSYDFGYISVRYKEKIREEYNNKVKKLSNFYSLEISLEEINNYKNKYKTRKNEKSLYKF